MVIGTWPTASATVMIATIPKRETERITPPFASRASDGPGLRATGAALPGARRRNESASLPWARRGAGVAAAAALKPPHSVVATQENPVPKRMTQSTSFEQVDASVSQTDWFMAQTLPHSSWRD
jgi:hypothetical protein